MKSVSGAPGKNSSEANKTSAALKPASLSVFAIFSGGIAQP